MARAASRPTEDEHHEAKGDDRRFGGPGCPVRRRIGQALQFHQQGDYPRAIGIYREYLDRDPDNARVLQILGLALRCDGDLDDAIVALSRSIAIDPNDAPTHCHLGNAYYEKSLLEDALSSFANAIDADPRSAEAFNDQGNVLRDLGRTEEAIASYRRTISIDATLAAPHFNLGNILWDSDRIDAAIESYRAAIEIDPGYAAAHNNLGNAYRAQSDLARAVRSYAEAVSCDGSFVLAHFNLANALNDLGRHDEALTAFRELLRYDPDNALARHMTAALTGEPATAAPHTFVRQVFDTYAGRFDTHLGATLDYRAPTALRDAVLARRTGSPPRDGPVFGRALDLGCGTGFVAEAFGDAVARFDGVDLSPRMLVEARRKNLYATLTEGEMVAHMEERAAASSGYDAILAADAFIYIGDLAPAFAAAAGCLAAGGVFAFSVELAETGTFELRRTGRFAQSEAYVRGLADGHGFVVEAVAPTVIRIEKGQPVNGAVFVLVNTPSPS